MRTGSWTVLLVGLAVGASLTSAQARQRDNTEESNRQPFEQLFASPAFAVVHQAERVEALPVEEEGVGLSSTNRVVERPVPLDRQAMRDIRQRIVSAKSYLGGSKACLFQPGLALRFHEGPDSVQALVCFLCSELVFERPGGDPLSDKMSFSTSLGSRLLAIGRKAFPGNPDLPMFGVDAQGADPDTVALPAVFVGAGIGPASNDAASRMRLYEDGWSFGWLVEAGVALSRRFGIGVEYAQPSAAMASTTVGLGRFQIAGRQEERVLLGVLRIRLAGRNRLALDAVGGAGAVFQHHKIGGCVPPVARCENWDGRSMDHRAPAFTVGADLPFRVARHFAIGAQGRVYLLRRGEHTSEPPDFSVPWQYEWGPSTRIAIGMTAQLVW